jgi:DNA repair protein RadC
MPNGGAERTKVSNVNHTEDWHSYEFDIIRKEVVSIGPRITTPTSMAEYFYGSQLTSLGECLWVAIVNGRNDLIGVNQVYKGTSTGTSVNISEILRPVILLGGVGFVLVHNHPSGDHIPSDEDLKLTKDVLTSAKMMDLQMLDHLVIGDNQFSSVRASTSNEWSW